MRQRLHAKVHISFSLKSKKYFSFCYNNLETMKNLILKYKNLLFVVNKRIIFFKLRRKSHRYLGNLY